MSELTLTSLDGWRDAIASHPRLLLFKHSPICPVSLAAREQWSRFLKEHPDAVTAEVDVIGARAAARGLADECGVRHESPQAILFVDGKATWNTSHHSITVDNLLGAWSGS